MDTKLKCIVLLCLAVGFAGCAKDQPIVLLPDSGLVNGGFEHGSLKGWEPIGYSYAARDLDTIKPFEGRYAAVLATAPIQLEGFSMPENQQNGTPGAIEQRFVVKEGHRYLRFRWNFLIDRFSDHLGYVPQDYFRVTLSQETQEEFMVLHCNTDIAAHLAGADVSGTGSLIPLSRDLFDQGYMTGWREASIQVAAFEGEEVTLRFETIIGDNAPYRIIVMLDGITLTSVQ